VRSVVNEVVVIPSVPRPDEEIQMEILERLRWDALVDHGLVRVRVLDGNVILRGTMGSAAEKWTTIMNLFAYTDNYVFFMTP